jgi:hypothetical protein
MLDRWLPPLLAFALTLPVLGCTSHHTSQLDQDDGDLSDAGPSSDARDDENPGRNTGRAGNRGIAGSGIAGSGFAGSGFGPTPGTGGSAGTGSSPVQVLCGSNVCTSPFTMPLPIPVPMPCCYDPFLGECGTSSNGGVCRAVSPPDPRCPQVASPVLALTSCCAANQMCGLDASMFGMGCVDFATLASQPIGSFLMLPSPTPCGDDEDAGI